MDRQSTILRLQQLRTNDATDARVHSQEAVVEFLNFIGEYDVATAFERVSQFHGFDQPVINEDFFDNDL